MARPSATAGRSPASIPPSAFQARSVSAPGFRVLPPPLEADDPDLEHMLHHWRRALQSGDLLLFVDYLRWKQAVLTGRGTSLRGLWRRLHWVRSRAETHGAEVERREELERTLIRLGYPGPPSPALTTDVPLGDLALSYTRTLLEGDSHTARRLILEAVESGTHLRDVYLSVLQPAQRELGRLWQTGEIGVAQEHLGTAITHRVMADLFPRFPREGRKNRRLVAACVAGELHELGIRMVADLFELDGWSTTHIGANTPTQSLKELLSEEAVDLLALSVTLERHLTAAGLLVRELRDERRFQDLRILVGGYAFGANPGYEREIGADAFASDAAAAVVVGNRLFLTEAS